MVMNMDEHESNTPESEPSENLEVCGKRRLNAEEIEFWSVFPVPDEGLLGFYMYWPDDFNLDEVFGLTEKAALNAYVDVYAVFDVKNQCVQDTLLLHTHEMNIFMRSTLITACSPMSNRYSRKKWSSLVSTIPGCL